MRLAICAAIVLTGCKVPSYQLGTLAEDRAKDVVREHLGGAGPFEFSMINLGLANGVTSACGSVRSALGTTSFIVDLGASPKVVTTSSSIYTALAETTCLGKAGEAWNEEMLKDPRSLQASITG